MEDGTAKVYSIKERQQLSRDKQFQESNGRDTNLVCDDMSDYFAATIERNQKVTDRLKRSRELKNRQVKQQFNIK